MTITGSPADQRMRGYLLVAILCAVYFFSQFLRNSVGVIAPDIADELSLSPEMLGLVSSSFFLAFAALQIPVGIAIDHYGAKLTMGVLMMFTVVGCVLFSRAQGAEGLVAGRVVMGIGCASILMGTLTIYTRWFSPKRFTMLLGATIAVGTVGTLTATSPLAWVSDVWGWRTAFLAVGASAFVVFTVALFVVRDRPPGAVPPPREHHNLGAALRAYPAVIKVKGVLPLFIMHFCCYAVFVTLLGLWAGPYFTDVHGLDLAGRGHALFIFAVAQIVGLFLWGPSDQLLKSFRIPIRLGGTCTVATLVLLAFSETFPVNWVIAEFALLGLFSGFSTVLTSHGRAIFPLEMVGRGITLMNIGTMGGAFVWQGVSGVIVGWLSEGQAVREPDSYRAVFLFLAAILTIALFFYRRAPDPALAERVKNV
ncbi:MAG: MFS transporter [Rhodobiaceae bacterium]|nr:MFS transporter [Rhodobiaceae bacterium]MCC0057203.1 MFS transporter [Rhodobiaceae bacterium]